jgi:hypothetical protein
MAKKRIKATKLSLNLPFDLGGIELEPDETQQRAAWKLYIELTTRIAVQPLSLDEGLMREALTSLYSLFGTTRDVLKEAGPEVGAAPDTVGGIAIAVLNRGLRPFLAKWHPRLQDWEAQRQVVGRTTAARCIGNAESRIDSICKRASEHRRCARIIPLASIFTASAKYTMIVFFCSTHGRG